MLKKRSFLFGSAKVDEMRACAAYALGFLGDGEAVPLLTKIKGDGSKLIREFAFTALKRLEHGK
jgi:HEAT repeat protein